MHNWHQLNKSVAVTLSTVLQLAGPTSTRRYIAVNTTSWGLIIKYAQPQCLKKYLLYHERDFQLLILKSFTKGTHNDTTKSKMGKIPNESHYYKGLFVTIFWKRKGICYEMSFWVLLGRRRGRKWLVVERSPRLYQVHACNCCDVWVCVSPSLTSYIVVPWVWNVTWLVHSGSKGSRQSYIFLIRGRGVHVPL